MKRTARLLAGFLLLAFLFFFVDLRALGAAFAQLTVTYVVYLILLSVVLIWISCVKWRLFIRVGGYDASLTHLMKLYVIGYFFNVFMPSFVGGDIVRSIQLGSHLEDQTQALVATFLERFTGLLAMIVLAVLFVLCGAQVAAGLRLTVLLVGVGAIVATTISFSSTLSSLCFAPLLRICRLLRLGQLAEKLETSLLRAQASLVVIRHDHLLLLKAMALSFLYQLFAVINTYVAARAIGWNDVGFGELFIVVPLVLLVSSIPATPSGLGLQEGAFVFFLKRVGATAAQGFAVGLIMRAKNILIALLGGLLWLGLRRDEKEQLDVAGEVAK